MMQIRWAVVFVVLGLLQGCVTPNHVYLTWRGDTSTTMVVNYQAPGPNGASRVYYDTEPRAGDKGAYRFRAEGASGHLPGDDDGRWVHHVGLENLAPDTTYYFTVEAPYRYTEHSFKTMPGDDSPIRFINGGDMSILPKEARLVKRAASFTPDFVLLGGDLAYENGDLGNKVFWDIWLSRWSKYMTLANRSLVPIVAAIGNHEVNDGGGSPVERAPFYFTYFDQGGQSHFSLRFGANLAIVVLDSDHIDSHESQAPWLAERLGELRDYPFLAAAYHVPLYPSNGGFDERKSVAGRTWWQPAFEEFGLDVAFEHHDHTLKRTFPLRDGAPSETGVVYLGDGCMGMIRREIREPRPAYLAEASGTSHFWVVDVSATEMRCQAVDEDGAVVDAVNLSLAPSAAPPKS